MDILEYNREAWNKQVEEGNRWTKPVDSQTVEEAAKGRWNVVLTPNKPVPKEWFPELKGKKVLCLASGGGQQGPVFAAAGAEVTVFDNSPAQLEKDQMVADRDGLKIHLVQGDMRNLSVLKNGYFDLIFHPVSNCFIDDIRTVWKECYRVLNNGGILLAGFCNPLTFIFDMVQWDTNRNLVVKYSIPYSDLEQLSEEELKGRLDNKEPMEFGHSLADQIGGQLAAGFMLNGFYEDTSGGDLLDPHISTFVATRAIKL